MESTTIKAKVTGSGIGRIGNNRVHYTITVDIQGQEVRIKVPKKIADAADKANTVTITISV